MHKVNSWCRLYRLPSNLKEMTGQSVSRVKTQRKHFVANGSVLNVTVQLSLSHSKMRVGCLDLVDSETTVVMVPVEHLASISSNPTLSEEPRQAKNGSDVWITWWILMSRSICHELHGGGDGRQQRWEHDVGYIWNVVEYSLSFNQAVHMLTSLSSTESDLQ